MARTIKMGLGAALIMLWVVLSVYSATGAETKVTRIDKETVKGWLSDPGVMIIDVRSPEDWSGSNKKIQGAIRKDPGKVDSWAKDLSKEKKIILYCA